MRLNVFAPTHYMLWVWGRKVAGSGPDGGLGPTAGVDPEPVPDAGLEAGTARDGGEGVFAGGEGDLADPVEFLEGPVGGEVLALEVGVADFGVVEPVADELFDHGGEHADRNVATHAGFGEVADRAKPESGLEDPSHRQRTNYRLTESAIQLVPVLATLGAWGAAWLPVSDELSARAKVLAEGGSQLWEQFMDELRAEHFGSASAVTRPTTRDLLDAAYKSATGA
jgi:hypothetical protein